MVPDLAYYERRNRAAASFALRQDSVEPYAVTELRGVQSLNSPSKSTLENIWDGICYRMGHICKAKLTTEIQVQIPHLLEASIYLEFLFMESH